jgi:FtsP/CotA-like multicopper oxidase with cupredoxin domain
MSFCRRSFHLLSRRQILAGSGIIATFAVVPAQAQPTAGPVPSKNLRAQSARARLRGPTAPETSVWTYDGTASDAVHRPVLRARRGDELRVQLHNALPEPTCIHWHGLRVPNGMDGVPGLTQGEIAPGGSFDYRFRLRDAGTFWFHPAGRHTPQTGQGLRGVLIVDEPEPVGVDRDLIVLLEDWSLKSDGALGDGFETAVHMTANGAPTIDLSVRTNERLRLRIVNATTAHASSLRIAGHEPVVVAIDGQPSEPFPARDSRVALGPGNRIDLLVDAVMPPGSRAAILSQEGPDERPLAHLVYQTAAARPAPVTIPKRLPANPLPERLDLRSAARQEFSIDIRPRPAPAHERAAHFSVRRGRVVVLACQNRTDFFQAVHLHGHACRLLDRLDDGWKPYWLDTLMVAPRQTERVAFLADNPGKWLIEARPVAAASPATEAWFEVT